jgi:hypothetical protein
VAPPGLLHTVLLPGKGLPCQSWKPTDISITEILKHFRIQGSDKKLRNSLALGRFQEHKARESLALSTEKMAVFLD